MNQPVDQKSFLNYSELANFLGVKPQTLRIWKMQGRLPCYHKINGTLIRFRLSDVEKWLVDQKAEGAKI